MKHTIIDSASIRHRHQIPPFNHTKRQPFSIFYVNFNQKSSSNLDYAIENFYSSPRIISWLCQIFGGISQHSQNACRRSTIDVCLEVAQHYFSNNLSLPRRTRCHLFRQHASTNRRFLWSILHLVLHHGRKAGLIFDPFECPSDQVL